MDLAYSGRRIPFSSVLFLSVSLPAASEVPTRCTLLHSVTNYLSLVLKCKTYCFELHHLPGDHCQFTPYARSIG
ncbi:hypothetical protein BO70DRAFT_363456 [Aspergillus heteromorphus CBS 117.55]|uniref:Secreted protein n=1 Tax=Aspergillus heteromorphus CBS 117.55 TaxID=1448321 RepID=A0A317VT63_9EURO|nr:uncharacterized protein BO70DRAFT_363456 [Aspergillus heteromorphus CBS 117.55]PWY77513.1 hypothetical protein BO70DRAFT_363456 [Aspergillus heteromorphus CBS 117.55]